MKQKEYRAKKAKDARLKESLAVTPAASPQVLQGGQQTTVTEIYRDPGAEFVDPDHEFQISRINAPNWGSDGRQERNTAQPLNNPTNQYYGIPEIPDQGEIDD